MISDFHKDLDFSHETEDLPIWFDCYQQFFPNMVTMSSHRSDGYWQREGVDRSVILDNTKQILIDEKARRKSYNDIALEYISNDQSRAAGWVCKPLKADYIAYAILPTGKCFLLPVIQLHQAWNKHGEDWKSSFFKIKAENKGYTTLSVAVPVDILFKSIGSFLRCNFSPILT